jgi:spectinomycin phosphotransferase
MFDRPPITDDQILDVLRDRYSIRPTELAFLALGHDAHAWTFRASADHGDLFVKIRRRVDGARLRLVRYLGDHGLDAVVAPIATADGGLSVAIDELHVIAYPFVEGRLAAEVGLDDGQWIEYGRIVGALHGARLPPELASTLRREQFRPNWTAQFERVQAGVDAFRDDDPVRRQLIEFWHSRRVEIEGLAVRALVLGKVLAARSVPADGFVP